jgi:intracellular septation protein
VAAEKTKSPGWLHVAVDYGPLIAFLGSYMLLKPQGEDMVGQVAAVIKSTLVFMGAAIVALGVSRWRFGRISPMLLLSTALIVVMGAITVWTGDQRVIQAKPTVLYIVFGTVLLIGYWRGKAFLQILLAAAFEGLDQAGWLALSRNWGFFFFFLAALNESLVHTITFEAWLWAKLWVFMPLSFLFTMVQLPMLLRHGLMAEGVAEEETNPPPG